MYIHIHIYVYIYIYIYQIYEVRLLGSGSPSAWPLSSTPNLPTNIVPTNIARLELSGKSPVGLGIPPLKINIMLESSPLKPTMLVRPNRKRRSKKIGVLVKEDLKCRG